MKSTWTVENSGGERLLVRNYLSPDGNLMKREVALFVDWNGKEDAEKDEAYVLAALGEAAICRDEKEELTGAAWMLICEFVNRNIPLAAHEGSCNPEAGCDASCMDRASVADAMCVISAVIDNQLDQSVRDSGRGGGAKRIKENS
jgi:hypothetical protein